MTVDAISNRKTNAELIADCATLGYLRADERTFDATYGKGSFWTKWAPADLTASDLYTGWREDRGRWVQSWDFTDLPCPDRYFGAVVFDPPYKLNGTSTGKGPSAADASYGVVEPVTAHKRITLVLDGITECARVADRMLLIKCQDQVSSNRVWWQERIFTDCAEAQGFRLVDKLFLKGSRKQPNGRRQVHARRNYSTLLVLCRTGRRWQR